MVSYSDLAEYLRILLWFSYRGLVECLRSLLLVFISRFGGVFEDFGFGFSDRGLAEYLRTLLLVFISRFGGVFEDFAFVSLSRFGGVFKDFAFGFHIAVCWSV